MIQFNAIKFAAIFFCTVSGNWRELKTKARKKNLEHNTNTKYEMTSALNKWKESLKRTFSRRLLVEEYWLFRIQILFWKKE